MADGNVFDQFDESQNLAAGQSVMATADTDPEIAARAQRAAAALGLPQSALTSVKDAETRVQVQQANAALPAAPKTAGWLVDRNNAAVTAPHEVSGLARLEQLAGAALIPFNPLVGGLTALDAFNQSYNQGAQPGDVARTAVSHIASSGGSIARGFGSAMDAITRLQEGPEERAFESEIGDHGPMPSDSTSVVATPLISAGQASAPAVETPITSAVGAASGFAPVVGAALLNPALGVVAGASQGADQIAQDAQSKGQAGSVKADIATLADAAVQGGLMLVGIKAPGMGVILPKIASPALKVLAGLGIATAENAATGAVMQGGSNLIEKATIDPNKDLSEGVADSAGQMVLFGALFHSAHMLPGAIKDFGDAATARLAANANATMVAAMREAEASPVAARAPGRFADLMSQIAPGQNAYVPADTVREFMQAKMSPEEQTQFADAAGIADQLPTAVGPGADIAFPVDKLLAVVARTPGATDAFADHLRVAPDGMSDAEGREFDQHYSSFIQERGGQLATEGATVAAAMAPAHAVYADVFSQARAAGYTIDAAQQHAALWASRYEARAALMGTDALSEFQRAGDGRGVAIRRALPHELVSRFDRLDPVIDALRRGAKARDTEGPSLLDYLSRNGGLKDEGGELSAMDAQTWHTAKPFRSRLVRPDGKSLEQAAEGAQEAGYLGAGHEDHIGQEADPAALLEAVRRELAGEKITARPPDQRAADFQRAVDGLDETLSLLGIDPEKATNAEIKAAVKAYQEERGRTLEQPAYHGSPHIFDKFDSSKIGTGEGAQAYGHGLYFAGRKEIAQHYRDALSERDAKFSADGETVNRVAFEQHIYKVAWKAWVTGSERLDVNRNPSGRIADNVTQGLIEGDSIKSFRDFLRQAPDMPEGERKAWIAALDEAERFKVSGTKGRLYHVDIPDDHEFLDWDKPLSEQSDHVKAALEKLGVKAAGAPEPPADPALRSILRRALKAADGDPTQVGMIIDNDQALYDAARKLDVGQSAESPGDFIQAKASKYLNELWEARARTGDAIYRDLGHHQYDNAAEPGRPDVQASRALHNAGIAGIRYLDAGSRSDGEGAHNYVVFDDSRVSIRQYEQDKRGSISLGDGPAIIRLFQGRDLSTLAHESGHLWLEELRADAARPDAPEQVKADWAAAAKWLGADPNAPLETEQHEQFARGFEQYLMEGRAPSEALRSVFQKFRSWLVNIYRNLSALNVSVSPEMKAVFDRLVATEDEISASAKRESLNPIFLSPEDGHMSAAEWSAYTHALTTSNEAARDQLMVKLMRDIRRTRTKEWRDERAALREDEAKQTDARPDVRAYHYLTRGELLGADAQPPARKAARNAVVMTFGTDAVLDRLPRGSTVDAGGVQPDEIADLTGHSSGEAMMERVMALEDARKAQRVPPRGVRKMLTDAATNEEMVSRHGDALHDGSIEEEAADALHNDARMQQVSLEVAALGKVNEERPWSREIFKRFAADEIASKRISDLRPDAFLRAERQAGNEAQRALQAGDQVKALERKRQQLLNMHFYRAARDARDLARRQLGAFDRFAKAKQIATIAQPYLDQIHALLQRYGYRVPLANLAATADLAKWRDEQEKEGASIYDTAPPNPRAMKDLSVTELDGLHDIVQNIAHLGRRDKELFVNGRREAKDALIDQAIIEAHGVKDMIQPGTFQGQSNRARGKGRWPRGYDAWQTKVEEIVRRLGGGPRSVLNQVLMDAASDAGVVKNGLLREVSDGLHKDYSALPREVRMSWARKVDTPELADPLRPGQAADLTHGQVVGILFNWGSASSKAKLLDGYGWEERAVKAVMDRVLTKADYDFAQGVWGRLQSLWPHIVKTEMELGGLAPEKVDPLPFSTPHGDYAGGYFPAHYDQELVARPINSWQDLFNRTFRQATTQKGHTISRTDFTGPIMLSPEGYLFNHVNNVITRISHGRFIRDANNFLRDPRIKRLISDKVGPEYYKQFDGWLQGQAGVNMTDPSALSSMDKFLRARRSNFIIASAAINPTVLLEHAGAFASSAQVIGEKALADGVARYAANPVAAAEFVFSRSPEFKDRIYAPTRDLKDLQDQLRASHDGAFSFIERKTGLPVSDLDRAGHKVQEWAHLPISYINAYVVGMPTWLGAFHDALGKDYSEADAIRIANKAVRISHGSGNAMDLSSAQRGPELMKLATMFYSWRSTQYQLQRASIWNTLHAQSPKQVGEGLRQSMYAFAITPLTAALVAGAAPALWPIIKAVASGQPMPDGLAGEWRAWIADELLRNLWSGTVGVRDLANAALNKVEGKPGGYEASPLERLPAGMIQAARDSEVMAAHAAGFQEESQVSKNAARNMVDTISEYQGIPIAPQAARGAAYAHGVATGEQNPSGPLDYASGLLHGAPARH